MGKVPVPPDPKPNKVVYDAFHGVQLTDPYLCRRTHSPYALNLISNNEGLPELRPGWRVLHTLDGAVNALAHGYAGEKEVFLAHAGTRLYQWTKDETTVLREGLQDSKSQIFFANHENKSKAWVLTGREYLVYDGSAVKDVSTIATVPVILIAKKPAGGGTPLYNINLLQPKRTEKFQGDGTSVLYQLAANNLDSDAVTVTQRTASGDSSVSNFTVNQSTGQVIFATPPPTPPVSGEDNIFITYAKTVAGYKDRIQACQSAVDYGEIGSGRVFVTRNEKYPNYDWWSDLNNPTYFPDLNYSIVGTSGTAIVGYAKLGKSLVLVKEDNAQDTTIFLRYPASLADGKLYFRMESGIGGRGALSPYAFASLIDEPLFLSRSGVYAITTSAITGERSLQNRSYFVDEALAEEENLSQATATEWRGYYLLAVGGKVYAFHARSKEAHDQSFVYNCFLWDNIPARCFLSIQGDLYFGDDKGRLCRFNTDMEKTSGYHDNGQAIEVYWATNLDHDGLPQMLKTMQKKGSGITTKPFLRSSYEIAVVTEKGEGEKRLKQFYRDIFDLNNIDFNRFTLESSPLARFTPFKKKVKKYQSLQIVVRAKAIGEGFGIYNIVKEWLPVNYVKR